MPPTFHFCLNVNTAAGAAAAAAGVVTIMSTTPTVQAIQSNWQLFIALTDSVAVCGAGLKP